MICSPWITESDLSACNCPETANPDVVDLSIQTASEIMYALTGRQYPGTCEATLRPCSNSGNPFEFPWQLWTYPWVALRIDGNWLNLGPCGCNLATDCACKPYPRINLGRNDVQTVDEVLIDDIILDPSAYRLDMGQYLVRTDGNHWPCCQDLALDSGPGTWSVTITYGNPIPSLLTRATAILATEYVKACIGDNSCRLPQRTSTVARQGLTIDIIDPQEFLDQGRTGLPDVDLAIQAVNPNHLSRGPRVISPETVVRGVWS